MHRFNPDNAVRLEMPERYALISPAETLRRFGVTEGMTVVDVGAGTGFFSRAASSLVGVHGRVIAADMSADMLTKLRSLGQPENLLTVLSREYSISLPDGVADVVVAAFVLHEIPDRTRFLHELRRLLNAAGRIIIIEWKKQPEAQGPPEHERLAQEDLDAEVGGFRITDGGTLNPSHYYRIIRPS
jgi:ubiquinone/menaquinone biosynthesis C-methylase UbiE